jgi:hypothetical protein
MQHQLLKTITMKTKLVFTLAFAIACLLVSAKSPDKSYSELMTKNIQAVYTAESISSLQQAVNSLERIGLAEKTKWEPYYYAAFGYIMMANLETKASTKDGYLDRALDAIKKASAIKRDDSEIIALEGFVHMIRITVDPATRGQQYSALGSQAFSRALALDKNNPRALALMAQMQLGTAQFFNSSTAEACATNDAALQMFASSKSDNAFAPQWGKKMAEEMKAKCN